MSPHIWQTKNDLYQLGLPKEEDPGFLFALVLNFLPTFKAMTKDRNKQTKKTKKKTKPNQNQNQAQTALRRVRDKITCNFEKLHDAWY